MRNNSSSPQPCPPISQQSSRAPISRCTCGTASLPRVSITTIWRRSNFLKPTTLKMLKGHNQHRSIPTMTEEHPEAEEDHIDAAAAALQRVRQAAAEAGYRPGMAGQFQRRSKTPRPKTQEYVRSAGPQPLGDVFSKFIAQRGWKEPVAVGSVLADWPSIVGP